MQRTDTFSEDDDDYISQTRSVYNTSPDGVNGKRSEEEENEEAVDNAEEQDGSARKTPYYDYASEKFDSQTDAKLMYQRHRLESSASATSSPVLLSRSATLPSFLESGDGNLSRTASRTSRTSMQSKATSNLTSTTTVNAQARRMSKEMFPALDPLETTVAADEQARSHKHHPGLPHESKDSLLAEQGMHGAGAGVGVGSGFGGYASSESSIVAEVEAICKKIKMLLDIRHRFLKISSQCPGDNPKDDETWDVYPPPPEPHWSESATEKPAVNPATENELSNSMHSDHLNASDGPRKRRKAGEAIGEDFDFNRCTIPGDCDYTISLDEGSVYQVYQRSKATGEMSDEPIVEVPTLRDFYMDLDIIQEIASDGPAKSFAYRRLQYLEGRYNLYTLLNEYEELADTKKVPHRDFYNVRKVDTHVHHSACMNQKHLLRFIKSKMKKSPDEAVIFRDGKVLTLKEVFESINLTAYDLSIDTLDMHVRCRCKS